MAFEPGGYSDKLGNRHEGRWVVKQLLRLLNEKVRSVTLEPIGDDQQGVDLIVECNSGTRQYQQCKARNISKEHWSVADLHSRGILRHLKFQLDSIGICYFGQYGESRQPKAPGEAGISSFSDHHAS